MRQDDIEFTPPLKMIPARNYLLVTGIFLFVCILFFGHTAARHGVDLSKELFEITKESEALKSQIQTTENEVKALREQGAIIYNSESGKSKIYFFIGDMHDGKPLGLNKEISIGPVKFKRTEKK